MEKILKTVFIAAFIALIVAEVFFGVAYWNVRKTLLTLSERAAAMEHNRGVLFFFKSLVTTVFRNKGEVTFDERLELENAVRALQDEAIRAQWNRFTGGGRPELVQQAVKDLLELLLSRVEFDPAPSS